MLTRGQLVIFVLGMAATAVVVALIMTIGQIRATQIEGTPTGKKLVAASDRILDCTDSGTSGQPAGKCYRANQRRTANLVGQIGAGNILAVVCALAVPDGTPTDAALDEVTECVTERLSH